MQPRRTFLAALGITAANFAIHRLAGAVTGLETGAPTLERIGLQLYTVRSLMRRNVEGTLARVASIGYREVEFAGYFGHSAAELRRMLDRHGLAAPSSHVALEELEGDRGRRAIDDAAALGLRWITVPWLPESDRASMSGWRRVAERLDRAGEMVRAAGMRLAYHNHDFEFRTVDGMVPYELLLAQTDPTLVDFQMDLYWTVRGGADPLALLAAHPRRFTMLHVKDSAGPPEHRMVDVGSGTIDFGRILTAFGASGATHCFVEHDQPTDPLASISASYAHLKSLKM